MASVEVLKALPENCPFRVRSGYILLLASVGFWWSSSGFLITFLDTVLTRLLKSVLLASDGGSVEGSVGF